MHYSGLHYWTNLQPMQAKHLPPGCKQPIWLHSVLLQWGYRAMPEFQLVPAAGLSTNIYTKHTRFQIGRGPQTQRSHHRRTQSWLQHKGTCFPRLLTKQSRSKCLIFVHFLLSLHVFYFRYCWKVKSKLLLVYELCTCYFMYSYGSMYILIYIFQLV
jgi:hypothetical protein